MGRSNLCDPGLLAGMRPRNLHWSQYVLLPERLGWRDVQRVQLQRVALPERGHLLWTEHLFLPQPLEWRDVYRSCLLPQLRARHMQQQPSVRLPLRLDWRNV